MTTEKTTSEPTNYLVHLLLIALVFTGIGLYLTYQRLVQVESQLNAIPKIAVFNMQKMISDKINAGEDPAKVIRHSSMIAKVAISEGYILLEKGQVLGAPEGVELPIVPLEMLEASLKAKGLTVKSIEELNSEITSEQKQSSNIIDEIMKR